MFFLPATPPYPIHSTTPPTHLSSHIHLLVIDTGQNVSADHLKIPEIQPVAG